MFSKLIAWFLPGFLDWCLRTVMKELAKQEAIAEKNAEREKTDAKNIKKLEECKTLAECIAQSRDTFNGVLLERSQIPE